MIYVDQAAIAMFADRCLDRGQVIDASVWVAQPLLFVTQSTALQRALYGDYRDDDHYYDQLGCGTEGDRDGNGWGDGSGLGHGNGNGRSLLEDYRETSIPNGDGYGIGFARDRGQVI